MKADNTCEECYGTGCFSATPNYKAEICVACQGWGKTSNIPLRERQRIEEESEVSKRESSEGCCL